MHMHTHTASAPINVQEYFVLLDLIGAERPLFYDNFVESSAIFQRLVKIGEHTHLTVWGGWGRVGEVHGPVLPVCVRAFVYVRARMRACMRAIVCEQMP